MDGSWLVNLLAQAQPAASGGWQVFLVAGVVFILPFILGQVIAQALQLKDLSTKIGVVLFSIFMSAAPFVYQVLEGNSWMKAIPLGIDLAGGTNLIYAIDREQAKADGKPVDSVTLNKMIGAVGRRINPSGAEEVTVRRVGEDRIEIIIPGADAELVKRKKEQIVALGSLEFAILANDKDHRRQIEAARKLRNDQDNLVEGGRVTASWRNVAQGEDVTPRGGDRTAFREVDRVIEGKPLKIKQFLVIHEPEDRAVTGRYLTRVQESMDQQGQLAVSFNFNSLGARLFSNLTGRYQPDKTDGFERRLAVLLNGEIQTAPNLKDRISGSGQISGNFSREEISDLINVLNAGALEVPLIRQPVSEFTISPTLGVDVQTKGMTAIIISAIAVFLFMLVYYRTAGMIANLSFILNLLLVVGAMAFIEATFTLPGLAGLVLTIGMAVDSNVLIYERMREEQARGSSLRMTIENGFDKALSTIIDSNVTSMITAVILYMIGSDQIRGFAVSLFIGLTMSLFSSLYFGHLCFAILERKRLIRKLTMLQIMTETNVDFLATRFYAFALSGAVILGGMGALAFRGTENFDIDFTGGTMVTFEFDENQPTEAVREKLVEKFGSTISLERLVLAGEQVDSEVGHRFRVRTTERDPKVVTEGLNQAFSSGEMKLTRTTLSFQPGEAAAEAAANDFGPRFVGGSTATLKFSNPLEVQTASSYLTTALKSIQGPEGAPKYQASSNLVVLKPSQATAPTDGVTPSGSTEAAQASVIDVSKKHVEYQAVVIPEVTSEDFSAALVAMQGTLAALPLFEEVNTFDTSVAFETQIDALLAILASCVVISAYIWIRFEKLYFGFAAIVALVHDVLVTLGSLALAAYLSRTPIGALLMLEDFKINLGMVASLLTIVGYSLNDTIVIFDRIREIKGKNPNVTYDMINLSVNQTLSRTLLTAATTGIVVVILYIFGGSGIHGFAFAMIVGVITGCYSTVYIANPALLWLLQHEHPRTNVASKTPAVPVISAT